MQTKVSLVIPIYNVEGQLDRCVKSIINQTYRDLEIILVDDGSKDNCPEMCDNYAKTDSRVTVVHKPNGGLPDARNAGLLIATGKYIMFVDSDDWINSNTVETLVSVMEEKQVDFIRFGAVWDGRDGIPDGTRVKYEPSQELTSGIYDKQRMENEIYPRLLITPDLFLGPVLSACFGMYNLEFLREKGIEFDKKIKYCEDSVFNAKVVINSNSFMVLEDCFYHYCFNGKSISFGKHTDVWDVAKIRYKHIEEYFKNCDKYDFDVQLKRVAIFSVLDGLSEWHAYDSDDEKLLQIRTVMNAAFTMNAMKNVNVCRIPFKKKLMLYMIKFKMAKLYFRKFNKKKGAL